MSNEPAQKLIPEEPRAETPGGDARLRAEIEDIVATIAHAKAALEDARRRHEAAEALLREAETRAQRMYGLIMPGAEATGAEAPGAQSEPPPALPTPALIDDAHLRLIEEQAFLDALGVHDIAETVQHPAKAEPEAADRVPTVSHVVSQLGRGGDEALAPPSNEVSAVRLLEAMVEELAAAMPVEPRASAVADEPTQAAAPEIPEPVSGTSAKVTNLAQDFPGTPAPAEPEALLEQSDEEKPAAVEAVIGAAQDEPPQRDQEQRATAADAQDTAEAADQPAPPTPLIPENELLTSFAQMATRPFLPPEIGTAVIFKTPDRSVATDAGDASAERSEESIPEKASAPESVHLTQAEGSTDTTMPNASEPAPEPPAGDLDALLFEPSGGADADPEAAHLAPTDPEAAADDTPATATREPELQDAEPAPQPPTAWATDLPLPESARLALARAAEPPPEEPPAAEAPPASPAGTPAVTPTPARRDADPLAPLRAMSDEEKIALFE